MRVFFDTSALVKRYVEEPDSGRVLALCRQAATLGVSVILLPRMKPAPWKRRPRREESARGAPPTKVSSAAGGAPRHGATEMVSTVRRLVRDSRLAEPDYARLKAAALRDLRDADLCDLTPAVLERTVGCLERSPLRAMDAIHLGSAIVYRPDLFVTADRRQLEAARKEGLAVEDLGASP